MQDNPCYSSRKTRTHSRKLKGSLLGSVPQLCLTLCNPMDCSTPGLPVNHKLPKFTQLMSTESVMPSKHLILSCPSPLDLNLSQHQGLFKWVSSSHEVAKVLEFQLQHQSFQWTPRTDLLLDGLVASPCSKVTLKGLFQHYSSKASILWFSTFQLVQFSHPYMTSRKTITLTRQTFVGKGMSLVFNMLSRLVITFLPRSKHVWISWLRSPSAVIL